MKLSVWQQFSSNHSASFTIVAQFETAELAEVAGEEMRTMLFEISNWWSEQENQDEIEDYVRQNGGLSAPEKQYAVKYQIEEWGQGRNGVLDWVQSKSAVDAVSVFERLVIVNQAKSETDTWAGARPFDEILRKLGAKVAVDGEGLETYLAMNLRCNAPDKATAETICKTAKLEQIRGVEMITLGNLYLTRGTISNLDETILIKGYQFHGLFHRPVLLSALPKEKQQSQVKAGNYAMITASFDEELQNLFQYLKSFGCTNFEYEFVEIPFKGKNE